MRAGKVTRPDRVTPSVPVQTTFFLLLFHLTLTLSFPASFLCPCEVPTSGSLMGKVNVVARAAHTTSLPPSFTFSPGPPPPLSPPTHTHRVTFSTRLSPLFSPLSLCSQSRTPTRSWLRVSPWCHSDCHLAVSACHFRSLCSSLVGWNTHRCSSPPCSCIHKASEVFSFNLYNRLLDIY